MMVKIRKNQILKTAQVWARAKKQWHFHILTPECLLNDTSQYVLVLENTTDGQVLACYSAKPYMDLGKKLVAILHGNVVQPQQDQEVKSQPSPSAWEIIQRAKQLNQQGIAWHHHMLFPGCKYNKHKDKWVIIFEDKLTGEILESVSDTEPKNDLKYIETLFYQQKKAG